MVPVLSNETSADQLYLKLQEMLGDVVPDFELKLKAELAAEINRLKIEKNAVILGHNYMEPALFHSIPDYVGDSLDLARRAATDGQGHHRLLRRAFHGRDGQDSQSDEDRLAAVREGRLLAGRQHHRRGRARVETRSFPACPWLPTSTPTPTSRPSRTFAAHLQMLPPWLSR